MSAMGSAVATAWAATAHWTGWTTHHGTCHWARISRRRANAAVAWIACVPMTAVRGHSRASARWCTRPVCLITYAPTTATCSTVAGDARTCTTSASAIPRETERETECDPHLPLLLLCYIYSYIICDYFLLCRALIRTCYAPLCVTIFISVSLIQRSLLN